MSYFDKQNSLHHVIGTVHTVVSLLFMAVKYLHGFNKFQSFEYYKFMDNHFISIFILQ